MRMGHDFGIDNFRQVTQAVRVHAALLHDNMYFVPKQPGCHSTNVIDVD